MYTNAQLQKLFTITNMVTVRIPKGIAGQITRVKINGADVAATYLTDLKAGEAIALLTDKGNWYLVGEAVTSENTSNKRNIEFRKTEPIPVPQGANIKILFSKIEGDNRNFYVLDENNKKKILAISKNINTTSIQGNIFNYGNKKKYINTIQYNLAKLNVINIVNSTNYPLWDVNQIYSSSNIPYLGSSIASSFYFPIDYTQSDLTIVYNPPGATGNIGDIQTHTERATLTIENPSSYFALSGTYALDGLAQYQGNTGGGDPGYSTYQQLTVFQYTANSRSFYLNKSDTNNINFTINNNNTTTYAASLADAGFSSASTDQIQTNNIAGSVYLGNYVKDEIPRTYTELYELRDYTAQSLISGSIVTTASTRTTNKNLTTNLLLIQGTKSSISCDINYTNSTITDNLTHVSTPTTVDNNKYYLNNGSEPLLLNRLTSVVINDFTTKITDETTTTVTSTSSIDLAAYVGQQVSYSQYIDAQNTWLAEGTISAVVPHTIGDVTVYTVAIALTNITKTNFVSYGVPNGRAISKNNSLFSFLSVFNPNTSIINRYILSPNYDSNYLFSFAELLKYGCLIGNKFYICQNNSAVKSGKTNIYVEQWGIAGNGSITRNNKLIKVPVNSLNAGISTIHSIQYWNKK